MKVGKSIGIGNFWVVGINYRKADTTTRGQFAVNIDQQQDILAKSSLFSIEELFILSTCNRTEVFGICDSPDQMIELLCTKTEGSASLFKSQCYIKKGNDAILHLYDVAAGLDSQILGDYEIIAQLKEAVKIATAANKVGPFLNRVYLSALQASRDIRSKTDLSGGTVSVAYAAIHYAKAKSQDLSKETILIIGMGKMGLASCKNLLTLSNNHNITIVNRTESTAISLAAQLGVKWCAYEHIKEAMQAATLIIVATNAPTPIILKSDFTPEDKKILIDLSIPNNIDIALNAYPNLHLANVDELSKVNDETLRMRTAEIPKAKQIINFHIHQFAEWYLMQKNVPYLKVMKEKLKELNQSFMTTAECEYAQKHTVQGVLNDMAAKMKTNNTTPGCTYIETLSDYLNPVYK